MGRKNEDPAFLRDRIGLLHVKGEKKRVRREPTRLTNLRDHSQKKDIEGRPILSWGTTSRLKNKEKNLACLLKKKSKLF